MASKSKFLGVVGVLVVAWLATTVDNKDSTPSPEATSPSPAPTRPAEPAPLPVASTATLEQCRDKLKSAAQLDLLADMSFDNGRPRVVVGPTWYKIDFSAKEGLAQTAACFFLAGDNTKAIRFKITDKMSGKVVAEWSGTRLRIE